jgi:glycosyltransferase involved in cell wall biosynthesis
MPRLLFLSHRVPYPPHSGAAARSYNLLVQLARRYDVTMLCFERPEPAAGGLSLAERLEALRAVADVQAYPIPQLHSAVRRASDRLEGLLPGRSYLQPMYREPGFATALARALTVPWDRIHVDSLDLAGYLPQLPLARTALTHHNHEAELLARRAEREPWLTGRYLAVQARRVRAVERRWAPQVGLNVFVSERDARGVLDGVSGARAVVIPNGVDLSYFTPAPQRGTEAAFLGGLQWAPNRDALGWFAEAVLPQLQRDGGAPLPVRWIGQASDAERAAHEVPGWLSLTGYVPDVRPVLAQAGMFIAPLRFGAGTKLKMLDAWASGLPVVATTVACEGLPAVEGDNVLVADDAAGFAAAMRRVQRDPALAHRLGEKGRRTVEAEFGWEALGAKLAEAYAALGTPTSPPR